MEYLRECLGHSGFTDTEPIEVIGTHLRTARGKQGPGSDTITFGECNQLGSKTIEAPKRNMKGTTIKASHDSQLNA